MIQTTLSRRLILKDRFKTPIKRIGGVDLAFKDDRAVAACVILDYENMEVLEEKSITVALDFSYRPGFLWFREGPPMLKVINSLDIEPEIFMINAHGTAHPRRFGSASHVGVQLGKPTIGVAGSRLYGHSERLPTEVGEAEPLCADGDVLGWAIKPSIGKPIYASPGHMVSLNSTSKITIDCLREHRFPEPLHLADKLANYRKKELD
jgi:deoxyribonuclease V